MQDHVGSGHGVENMTIRILEKVKKLDTLYRKEREKHFIRKCGENLKYDYNLNLP